MLVSFSAGTALSIGHHFFYQSLNDRRVEDDNLGQQFNIGVGTAFAFLVRFFLVMAVGVAFAQVLWRRLLRNEFSISSIDSVTQLLTSIFDILSFRTLWQHRLLGALGLISWMLPFATIVPPATLSVQPMTNARLDYNTMDLPFIDFSKSTFSKLYVSGIDNFRDSAPTNIDHYYFGGSMDDLSTLARVVALQGTINPIQPPTLNSSYNLPFFGPALSCNPTSPDIIKDFDVIFGCNFSIPDRNTSQPCGFGYDYLAWVPNMVQRVYLSTSDQNGGLNFQPRYDGSYYGMTTAGGYRDEPTMVYIGIYGRPWTMLNCSLYNASYIVDFSFQSGGQKLQVVNRELLNGLPFVNLVYDKMNANLTEYGYPPQWEIIPEANFVAVNYQAIMDSFGQIIVGGINHAISRVNGGQSILSTLILSTKLKDCPELGGNSSLTLAAAAEQLFENITLSLFSRSDYVSLNSSMFPSTNVTTYSYPNIYVYTWERLVLAYGLAVLFAGIAVVVGGIALLANGESYSYTFSTIVRTTRLKAIDRLVRPEDTAGQSPLPGHIAEARVILGLDRLDEEIDRGIELPRIEIDPEIRWEAEAGSEVYEEAGSVVSNEDLVSQVSDREERMSRRTSISSISQIEEARPDPTPESGHGRQPSEI